MALDHTFVSTRSVAAASAFIWSVAPKSAARSCSTGPMIGIPDPGGESAIAASLLNYHLEYPRGRERPCDAAYGAVEQVLCLRRVGARCLRIDLHQVNPPQFARSVRLLHH